MRVVQGKRNDPQETRGKHSQLEGGASVGSLNKYIPYKWIMLCTLELKEET